MSKSKPVAPENRKRAAPKPPEEWGKILHDVHAHLVHVATNDLYVGSLSAVVKRWMSYRQIPGEPQSIIARLQTGGWITYDDKSGGTSNWVIKPEPVTPEDGAAADALFREQQIQRNQAAGGKSVPKPATGGSPPPSTPAAADVQQLRRENAELRRQITQHSCPQVPADVVSRETYDKDMGDMHSRLDDAESLVRALMTDPKMADLIRKAIKVTREL